MLPLTKNRRIRISNRLAVFAASLLVVTSLAGVGGSTRFTESGKNLAERVEAPAETTPMMRTAGPSKVNGKRGFKVSLFLFRNH